MQRRVDEAPVLDVAKRAVAHLVGLVDLEHLRVFDLLVIERHIDRKATQQTTDVGLRKDFLVARFVLIDALVGRQ